MPRHRLDQILADDPHADVIIGGDLNSHYNQKARYSAMARTAIDDILQAGYSEPSLQRGDDQLYNLWYELPAPDRGSDVYRGKWGSLMHLIISRGLYDQFGVQYQDNSFHIARHPGVNADSAGAPIRWTHAAQGHGFSDHLPIYAHFRTIDSGQQDEWMALDHPSDQPPPADVWSVNYAKVDFDQAINVDEVPDTADLTDGSWTGRLFKVTGPAIGTRYPQVRVAETTFRVYAPSAAAKDRLKAQAERSRILRFYGELGTYKGDWQFVVRDVSWVL